LIIVVVIIKLEALGIKEDTIHNYLHNSGLRSCVLVKLL